jgi:hypothetical protein
VHQVWNRPGVAPPNAIHVIREPMACLAALIVSLALAALVPLGLFMAVAGAKILDGILLSMLAGSLAYCAFLIYLAVNAGIVVDMAGDSVEFWGRYFAANSISDYFSPAFLWMKFFGRANIRLSEISQIVADQHTTRHKSNKGQALTAYFLILNGAFGSAKILFGQIEKRDELLAVLRQANRMGFPVTVP